jgi:hypothetical protein
MGFFHKPADAAPFLEPELRSLEDALGRYRPVASRELLAAIAGPNAAPAAPARRPGFQVAFAVGLSAALFAALLTVGGVSYAANAVTHAARSASAVLVTHVTYVGKSISAGGDQYRPGYGFGDPNHNHTGPPGLTKGQGGGSKAPPAQTSSARDRKAILVSTAITADEQAALYFSVLDPKGTQLLLTQRGSTIGGGVQGPQVKTIHYVMLVPRTIPLQIRVPANLLVAGRTYRIRVIAVDAQGDKSTLFVAFTA